MAQENFKPMIVHLILAGKTELAITFLSQTYRVTVPKLQVGLPKKHKTRAYGTYTAKTQMISVQNSDILTNPFVVLHEFYHHLRSSGVDKMHRGTEKNADTFARDYLVAYQNAIKKAQDYIQ